MNLSKLDGHTYGLLGEFFYFSAFFSLNIYNSNFGSKLIPPVVQHLMNLDDQNFPKR